LAGLPPGAWGASAPQQGYESSGSLRPEFQLDELRAHVGKKYWVRRPLPGQAHKALFCHSSEAPTCPSEKFSVEKTESFTVADVVIAKPNPANSWLKIQFESGKTAYVNPQDFSEHRYREDRISVAVYGIDYAIANAGWIFDEYPELVLNRRRAQLERNEPGKVQEQVEKVRVTRASVLHVGMTFQQVLNSSWGHPNRIGIVTEGYRTLEQWDYGLGNLLYFDRGRLYRFHSTR
jgi:hypothetical protein